MNTENVAHDRGVSRHVPVREAISPIMVRLSTYMSEAAGRALPASIVRETKHHILDTLAAMVSGADLIPGQHDLRFARSYGGAKVAIVWSPKAGC